MIYWLTGNTGAGKTTLATEMQKERPGCVVLDGDEMRESINRDLTLSAEDRRENNLRIARLAKVIADQGHDVVVSVICPYEALRAEVKAITGCIFVYLHYDGDDKIPESPYEPPKSADITVHRDKDSMLNSLTEARYGTH